MKINFQKAQISVYKLLKEGGRQSELNETVEYFISAVICLSVAQIVLESMTLTERVHDVHKVHLFFQGCH